MKKTLLAALILVLPVSSHTQSERPADTHHIRPAYTIHKHHLFAQAHVRFFFRDQIQEYTSGLLTGETYWDIQNGLQLSYGLSDHVELRILQIIYQDNHKMGSGYNLPDDLFLTAQAHLWQNQTGHYRVHGQMEMRLPTAAHHNLPLEPYSSDRIGAGFTVMASRLSRPDAPGTGLTVSANAGLFNHNDHGVEIGNVPGSATRAEHNVLEMAYGLALQQTMGRVAFFAELYGRSFLRKPPTAAYTRENSLYFSPGMTMTLPSEWRIRTAVDLRISGDRDETSYGPSDGHLRAPWTSLPNLPDWRVNFALQLPIYPALFRRQPKDAKEEAVRQVLQAQTEEAVLDELTREQQKTENAEKDLARIQAERQRIEQTLKKIRDLLENPTPPQEPPENP